MQVSPSIERARFNSKFYPLKWMHRDTYLLFKKVGISQKLKNRVKEISLLFINVI